MREIEEGLETAECSDNEKEELPFVISQAKQSIECWKAHLLRSINQNECRLDIMSGLSAPFIFLVFEWVMKYLPHSFFEIDGGLNDARISPSKGCDDDLSVRLKQYYKNIRIAYLNINSVAGFKLQEVKSVILQGLFDIVILAETKIDADFPDSQFYIKGFRMFRKDRNRHGGGLLIYTRRGLITLRVSHLECVNIETIALSFQTRKNGPKALLMGTYRPPNLSKSVWESQLNNMLLRAGRFNNIFLVGDLNCDLLNPDGGAKDGRALIDLIEVYRLSSLIKEPTRITNTSN
ncbi:hypothetical protein AWC38_SpisGene21963 [Stylophora pistillata]|uniref:Endonuclease/exonuclease/phosphatase domain-containing protein n=1 Tax=Stylophora pistillata TaxID=50429 RepID=A0A2B4R8E9_STYPI|nr:hypothetical protein AWC38_SpisGene21963 [Stylophora pistillata]